MATTQESYRLRARNTRYTTKLAAFANGMYLTDQIIPEGYAKIMLNYDIDDTGSHIKPRYGRELIQTVDLDTIEIGAVTLTDYVYEYSADGNTANLPQDLVVSYGTYANVRDIKMNPDAEDKGVYVIERTYYVDENVYDNIQGTWTIFGDKVEPVYKPYAPGWALYYDKVLRSFEHLAFSGVGSITARTIKNAYAFDKAVQGVLHRPIAAVLNNELLAFSNPVFRTEEYPNTPERNNTSNFNIYALTKLKMRPNLDGKKVLVRSEIEPRELNASEAVAGGFNLMMSSPYVLEQERKFGTLMITGLLPYDRNDRTVAKITIRPNETISVEAYYTYRAGTNLKYRVTWYDLAQSDPKPQLLKDWGTETVTAGERIYYDYTPTVERSTIRIELRENDDETTTVSGVLGIICNTVDYEVKPEKFYLDTAKGTIVWQGCLGLYGVDGAPDSILFSAPEDPSYFPYPYNLLTFDNEVLAVHNYLDMLIVVTVDSLWLVTIGDSIMTSTQKKVLENIYIPEIDAINLVVLKDQIFFKTDTQFYVLKPNNYRSDATDLKNYVNSTAIANFTKNFTEETVHLLNETYRKVWQDLTRDRKEQVRFSDFDVTDIVSYIRNEEVHYVYTITPKLTGTDSNDTIIYEDVNLHLVYNTLTRAWRIYLVCVGDDSVRYKPVLYRNKQSGDWYEFITRRKLNGSKVYITKQTYDKVSDNIVDKADNWQLTTHYDNYPYLDSGNIALDDMFNKRFRELQFNILNRTHEQINFFTDFKLDGIEWMEATKYLQQHILDKHDPDYGSILITPIDKENLHIYGTSVPTDKVDPNPFWSIDLSCFPELAIATVRFTLQGKGRRASFQLLNTDLKQYELSDVTWVYRIMNAR